MRRDIEQLMRHALPGPPLQKERIMRRANTAANMIERERGKKHPHAWQMSDVRWYLDNRLTHLSPSTQYDHWLAIVWAVWLLGHLEHWEPTLEGPWCYKTGEEGTGVGGRPRRLESARLASD